jgi:purine-nucleoside phosphorylase
VADRIHQLADTWRDRVGAAVSWLQERGFPPPAAGGRGPVGLILGSGLGNLVEAVDDVRACPYGDIPGFTTTTVAEHQGRLVSGTAAGVPVVVMQGRLHPYEGLPAAELLLPTAVLGCLGVAAAVVTNAAGGLNRFYEPGDLMVIRDQVDLHLQDPLRGLLTGESGRGRGGRAATVYDSTLARELQAAGAEVGVPLYVGTYASVWGPSYETKAEIGWLRRIGCDAVGMSTAPETVLLARLGIRVVGLSCITNPSREVGQPELSHQDVVETGRRVRDDMARLLLAFLPRLADPPRS